MSMKKGLVCLLTLLASALYMNVWGAGPWKKGGVEIVASGTTLTVSAIDEGTRGVMTDYDDFDGSGLSKRPAGWSYSYTTIIVEEGVKTIGAHAFQGLTNITTVKLPTTLTNIRTDAFKDCTGVANLYYAGSPTEWASSVTFSNLTAHPCGARTSGSEYYFFGYSSSRTDLLILEPTITEIKPYAFYRIYLHTNSVAAGLCIPGTITTIGTKAFYGATLNGEIACNKATAPTLETDALNTTTTGMTIYIPTGATGYTNENGWNRFSTKTQKVVGGSDIGSEISKTTDITWSLSESGVLTLNATSSTKNIEGIDGASSLPWRYFRRLVHTVKLQGEITGLNNMLHYNYGLGGIKLDQTTIPTISTTYIATGSAIIYANLANKRDKLKLSIKQASLGEANLSSAPWNDNTHWQVQLAEPAVFAEDADNATWLANADTYLDVKTFDLKLYRTISNSMFNTFCSPIDIDDVDGVFGEGTELYTLESSSFDAGTEALTLTFSEATEIEKGKPYIIKPANTVENPVFSNVNLSDILNDVTGKEITTSAITFYGTLARRDVTSAEITNKNFIILTGNFDEKGHQLLDYANGGYLKGMRAYWIVSSSVPAAAIMRRPIMNFGDGEQGIESHQLSAISIQKIFRNGQLIIVRDGKEFNAQGLLVH